MWRPAENRSNIDIAKVSRLEEDEYDVAEQVAAFGAHSVCNRLPRSVLSYIEIEIYVYLNCRYESTNGE